jgi:four helix bundle protein
MATITRFEDIQAWQVARELTRRIYQTSASGNFSREFTLRDQICRAALSPMSNIAEGLGRNSDREFVNFLGYASGSTHEVQSQLYVALDLAHITNEEFSKLYALADETKGKIGGFIHYLKTHTRTTNPRSK